MITAAEALALSEAQLTSEDRRQIADALKRFDKHIRANMAFTGTADPSRKLEIAYRDLSSSAVHALGLMLPKAPHKWIMRANLMAFPPMIPGGAPDPHHWEIAFAPSSEAYEEAGVIPDFPSPLLA